MTPAAAVAAYRRQIGLHGQVVTLQRSADVAGDTPIASAAVRARVLGYRRAEIEGGMQQADRRVVFLAEDVEGFPLPIRSRMDDFIVIGDERLAVEAVDDWTHSVAGVLVAYELHVRGGGS